jgi:hypothetical protein
MKLFQMMVMGRGIGAIFMTRFSRGIQRVYGENIGMGQTLA